MQTTLKAGADSDTRQRARRGLAIYFAVLVPLSALIQAITIRADLNGGENGVVAWLILMTALMSIPTIDSVVARMQQTEIHTRPGECTNHELWIAS